MPSYKAEYKMALKEAQTLVTELTEELTKRGYTKVEVMGSIRRKENWIGDIDLIVLGDSLLPLEGLGEPKERGDTRWTIIYKGQQVNIFKCKEDHWGAMAFYLTGPTSYTIAYRCKARRKNWNLNQYGLFDAENKLLAARTEAEIYKCFDKEWKDPTKRGH
jgi:DNA polymerase (family 10)